MISRFSSLRPISPLPDRPNPIGLHNVEIVSIDGPRLQVRDLEALDGTPIVDVKPVLSSR